MHLGDRMVARSDQSKREDDTFRVLAKNIPGVVYLCANDVRYTMHYLSEAVFELTGISAQEFLADRASFVELYHPDDAAWIPQHVDRAVGDRRQFKLLYRLKHAQQGWRWVEEFGQGVFDHEGRLKFLEGVVFDVSARKAAEDAVRKSRDELEARIGERTAELQDTVDRLKKERKTLKALIRKQEHEHRLLAYEIHDGLVQYATGALMKLESIGSEVSESPNVNQSLDEARQWIRDAVSEARRIIGGLRPPILDDMGIVAAIDDLLHGPHWPAEIVAEFDHDDLGRFPSDLETVLFRITQEALTNVRLHSQSSKVRVTLRKQGDRLRLKVRDWGVGFDTKDRGGDGFGLRGIRERVKLSGGRLKLKSSPGKGTLLRVDLPSQIPSADAKLGDGEHE